MRMPADWLDREQAPRGRHSLRRGEAQRDHGACKDGELAARAAPLLRLAANGEAVAATSRHIGLGREVPRCRGIFLKGATGLLPPHAWRTAVTPAARDGQAGGGRRASRPTPRA